MEFLLSEANTPFTVAICVFLGLFTIEVLLLLFGASVSDTVDDILPDIDMDSPDFSIGKALTFVGFGRIPTLMVLMAFLVTFGLLGLGIQSEFRGVFGSFAPAWAAACMALIPSLFLTGQISRLLARVLPSIQTVAVTEASLVGRAATVVYGTATSSLPATAELRDEHGRLHHVQIKAAADDLVLTEGQLVFISKTEGGFYYASPDKHIIQ